MKSIAGGLHMNPATVWAMTPFDTLLLLQGHNEATKKISGAIEPPSVEEFEALKELYPDG